VAHSLEQRRTVIIIDGSGRTADVLAEALRGKVKDTRAGQLAASGLLTSVRLADGPNVLRAVLHRLFEAQKAAEQIDPTCGGRSAHDSYLYP
jgi:hypothetical protein